LWKEDKPLMLEAYSMLYDIEMIIVHDIVDSFRKSYGFHWFKRLDENIDFTQASYRKLISYLKTHNKIFPHVDDLTFKKLYKLYLIRNKICHMKPLTEKEFQYLEECHELVNKVFVEEKVDEKREGNLFNY